jgi:hypothetical protein
MRNSVFTIFRRVAVKQLLDGRMSAEEGLQIFVRVDDEYQAGRTTVEEFREYVDSLDQALIRENHPLRPVQ